MEKHEFRDRVLNLCVNAAVGRRVVAYLQLEFPQLANSVNVALGNPSVQVKLSSHHKLWQDSKCIDAPGVHGLTADQSFSVVSSNDGMKAAREIIEKHNLVIIYGLNSCISLG